MNVTNPQNPYLAGSCEVNCPKDIYISGYYAFIANGSDGLLILNLNVPSAPVEISSYNTPGYAYGVSVSGEYAYVADGSAGLRVINISDLANPYEVGYYNTLVYDYGVAVSGDYACLAEGYYGLRIIDVSDPYNPYEVSYCETPGDACDVAVSGEFAFVADYECGLRIIEISDPYNPIEVGYYDTSGDALGIVASGDYAYVADGSHFEIFDCSQALPVLSPAVDDKPKHFTFYAPFPNPFNPLSQLRFDLPEAGDVSLIIYDIQGREVAILADSWKPAGTHNVRFDGSDFSSGMYFVRLKAGEFTQTQKMLLIK